MGVFMHALKERPPDKEESPAPTAIGTRASPQPWFWQKNHEDNTRPAASEQRDRPLDLRWRLVDRSLTETLMRELGPPTSRHSDAWEAILAGAIAYGYSDRPSMSYSRSNSGYAAARNYLPRSCGYETVVSGVERLEEAGLLMHDRKTPGRRGFQSWFRIAHLAAEPPLLVRVRHREPLVLRGGDKHPIAYPETDQTRRLHRILAELNEMLSVVNVSFPSNVVPFPGSESYLTNTELHQVFTRDFHHHGRLYADYQNTPKAMRRQLLINGEPSVELDFGELHIRLLASERRIDFRDSSPYEIRGLKRDEAKAAINILLNAPTEKSAVLALAEKFGGNTARRRARECIDAVAAHHQRLADAFGRSEGLRLMRRDADIAEAVVRRLGGQGIPCLPIHDSFLVPVQNEADLDAAMREIYREQVGQNPAIKRAA